MESAPKDIAVALSIGIDAVHFHLFAMRKLLGAHSNIEMLHILYQNEAHSLDSLKLTPRGKEVFALMLTGMADKKIAERLGISYSGVRRHKEKMLLMNGCNTVLELVSKYYAHCNAKDYQNTLDSRL